MGKFDEILFEINDFGKYQKIRFYLICISALMPAIVTYVHQFIAAKPPFKCDLSNQIFYNHSIANVSSDQCSYYFNGSEYPCDAWIFDKTYYQSTLTEEVSFYIYKI